MTGLGGDYRLLGFWSRLCCMCEAWGWLGRGGIAMEEIIII